VPCWELLAPTHDPLQQQNQKGHSLCHQKLAKQRCGGMHSANTLTVPLDPTQPLTAPATLTLFLFPRHSAGSMRPLLKSIKLPWSSTENTGGSNTIFHRGLPWTIEAPRCTPAKRGEPVRAAPRMMWCGGGWWSSGANNKEKTRRR
jgi:hypothetical protein